MLRPLVSVIMPAYNVERFVADAVASVVRQTWSTLELVIVDDGSTDATGTMCEDLAHKDERIRVLHKMNGGLSSARNAGMAVARGEYLCFLDSDDVFLPDKLRAQTEFLELFPSCDLVFSDHYAGTAELSPTLLSNKRPPAIPMRELLAYLNWFGPPLSALLRTSLQRRVGTFDESLRSAEDWDFWIRASRCGAFAYLPVPVGVYRQHSEQMIRNWARMRDNQERVIAKHFEHHSREWRIAKASRCFTDAKWQYGRRDYARMVRDLCRCAWYARSSRTLRTIKQLLSS